MICVNMCRMVYMCRCEKQINPIRDEGLEANAPLSNIEQVYHDVTHADQVDGGLLGGNCLASSHTRASPPSTPGSFMATLSYLSLSTTTTCGGRSLHHS